MHLKVIACEVLAREVYYCAARAINTVDIELMPQGLHDNSDICRERLQPAINAASPEVFDAVLLGYGLCSNAAVGLRAGCVPLVIPRAHDCITLFLGSHERYEEQFRQRPGTYYYTSGWLEHTSRGGDRPVYAQKSGLARWLAYEELVEKYGEENADYISQTMDQWETHYTHGVLIRFPFDGYLGVEDKVREICAEKGWTYDAIPGDLTLIQDLLDGKWACPESAATDEGDDRFLVLQPGASIEACHDGNILRMRPAGALP